MQSQHVTLRCDFCDNKITVPIVSGNLAVTPAQARELADWSSIVTSDGVKRDFCKKTCLENGAKMLTLPSAEPAPEEKVDLSKLQELAAK